VGQLDERALFYLRSRGVPLSVARNLLIAGFCREVFEHLDDAELRARLETALVARLPQAEGGSP
jgi:Fe-S cluster assembly protein SufD